jgi:hypothetical protein
MFSVRGGMLQHPVVEGTSTARSERRLGLTFRAFAAGLLRMTGYDIPLLLCHTVEMPEATETSLPVLAQRTRCFCITKRTPRIAVML